jgi:AbrB family looped-hinge helix DNA binding protein
MACSFTARFLFHSAKWTHIHNVLHFFVALLIFYIFHFNMSATTETGYVTSKGQLVVPARLRRKFGIKEGTRLNFSEENGRIVIQPVTREYIRSFRGILKSKPGEPTALDQLYADRGAERKHEKEKHARYGV